MKKIVFILFVLFSVKSFSQVVDISHPFLINDFYDFGMLDPFERCNNTVITTNSLSCQVLNNQEMIQITIPTTFLLTNSAVPVDIRIIKDTQPIPGSSLAFNIVRGGSTLPMNSIQTIQPNIAETFDFVIDIWLFGVNATNQQIGEASLELIIP